MIVLAEHMPASVWEPLLTGLSWMYWIVLAALTARIVFLGGRFWMDKQVNAVESSSGIELACTLAATVIVGVSPKIATALIGA
ncbi:hypothetical protein L1O03_02870 [Corynebacterium uropygiale]|uniref:Uncharacterized protein n=1 Tax=Corynebacterium uropygiale TaxID=1775911 RepID=A0A9X1QSC0_9CORY|nr:hypothetical protein [Corynebacterium uropygiale]MCF4006120.1 hypothetical protein [Corynebacterium uropygiale]